MNIYELSAILYALVSDWVLGYWVTPSKVTKTSRLAVASFDRVNNVVLPLAVNSSIVLSVISKLGATSPINVPNTLSVAAGAVLNTIVESAAIPKPSVGLEDSTGLWLTPLTEIVACAALLIFVFVPPLWVALNFVLIPSKATFNVCVVPAPRPVKLIPVPAAALLELVANFIVFWSTLII